MKTSPRPIYTLRLIGYCFGVINAPAGLRPNELGERSVQTGAAVDTSLSFPRGITRYQWLVFFVVWAGWTLDAADFGLYSLVLQPALKELMANPTPADIGRVGGLISTAGLLGWAFGGFTFGIIADYIGRVRTLALSILIFSVFTALQGLSQTPLQLGIFRFFAGVGTGAEIIVGIPFVAEVFAEKNRARILGVMMTGGAVGTLLAAQVYNLIGHMGWRWVFYVGIVPALLLVFIRRGMVEPERFAAVRERRQALAEAEAHAHSEEDKEFMRFVPLQLFNPQNRFSTLVGLLVLRRHAARDLDQQHLAADDPAQHPGRRRHPGQRRDLLYQLRDDDVGAGRHARLCRVRLYRRRDRPAADDPAL